MKPEPNWDHIPHDLSLFQLSFNRMGVAATCDTPEKFQFLCDYLSLLIYNRNNP